MQAQAWWALLGKLTAYGALILSVLGYLGRNAIQTAIKGYLQGKQAELDRDTHRMNLIADRLDLRRSQAVDRLMEAQRAMVLASAPITAPLPDGLPMKFILSALRRALPKMWEKIVALSAVVSVDTHILSDNLVSRFNKQAADCMQMFSKFQTALNEAEALEDEEAQRALIKAAMDAARGEFIKLQKQKGDVLKEVRAFNEGAKH